MYTGLKSVLVTIFGVCFFRAPLPTALASDQYQTRVKVIHATKGPAHVDPGIQGIVSEIQPVFNYNNFRVLKVKEMTLTQGQKGRMDLPGKRALIITPAGMKGNRIQYNIQINAKGNPVFQTGVRLKNGSSVTIGGPKFKKGVLLINIQGRAQ